MGNVISSFASSPKIPILVEPRQHAQNTVYAQLDTTQCETRICRILPPAPNGMIACELEKINLEYAPQYKCLSYAWGKHDSTAHILLNGKVIAVTANLHIILEHLQGIAQDTCFWIDIICINQSDIHEKGQQVALMGRIYRTATEVFVWLGPQIRSITEPSSSDEDAVVGASDIADETWDAAEAVAMLRFLAEGVHFHELPYFDRCCSERCHSSRTNPTRSWNTAVGSLITMLEVPWFTRTWVVQEIVLARNAVLMHGEHSLPWNTFVAAWRNWDFHSRSCCAQCVSTLSKPDYVLFHRVDWIVLDLDNMRQPNTPENSLLRLLQGFRGRQATDGRDKIYGMLGLVSDDSPLKITPNYELSVVEAYTKFAIQLIQVYDWLLPLHLQLDHNISDLPSWVPDWTFHDNDHVEYSLARLRQAPSYCAGRLSGERTLSIVGRTLHIEGTKVDTVKSFSEVFTIKDREDEHLNLILSWRNFFDLDRTKNDAYICGGTLFAAYQATVFAGRYEDETGLRLLNSEDTERWDRHLKEVTRRLRGKGPALTHKVDDTMSCHNVAVLRRRLCVLAKGYIGLCPARTEVGDEVYVLDRAPAPIFLRPIDKERKIEHDDQEFRALGHGYVHGIMDGEVASMGLPTSRIRIV